MSQPRLTIGVPCLDRAQYLTRAIRSILGQPIPTRVLVADQGHTDAVRDVMAEYRHHDLVRHIKTDATCLWENWRAAALAADTEFFAWLQDDDIVAPYYTSRILKAFDACPTALSWIARLDCSNDGARGIWYATNGPLVPMDTLTGIPSVIEGKILIPVTYCVSMGLSPAVAFRRGPEFTAAVHSMPTDCDLFAERMILAGMGLRGPAVCDPKVVGYWIHHGRNESYRQQKNGDTQRKRLCEWTDVLMDEMEESGQEWRYPFRQWVEHLPPGHMAVFANELVMPNMAGRHVDAVKAVFADVAKSLDENDDKVRNRSTMPPGAEIPLAGMGGGMGPNGMPVPNTSDILIFD